MEIWSLTSSSVFSDYMACISDSYDLIEEWGVLYGPEFWLESMERYFNVHLTTPGPPLEYIAHPKKKCLFDMVSSTLKRDNVNLKNLCQFISTSLYTTIDSQYICDVLIWFHNLKKGSEKEKELFNVFVSKVEENLFYYLLGSDIEQVRILSLEFILKIVKYNPPVRRSSLRSPLRSPLLLRTNSGSEISLSFDIIVQRMKMAESTVFTCRKLVGLAFGYVNVDNWITI